MQQYNIIADRGNENSRVYQNNGLTYRILDENGEKVGVPIKASDFNNKPTLKFLEERFPLNENAKQSHKTRVKNTIDLAFLKQPKQSLHSLIKALGKEGIITVSRQNADGIIYGLTYVDHKTKCVFNGSAIGKQYSAKGILERCNDLLETPIQKQDFVKQPSSKTSVPDEQKPVLATLKNKEGIDLLETLLRPELTSGFVPHQLTKKGERKRKKRISRYL